MLIWNEQKRFFAFSLAEYLRLAAIPAKGTKKVLTVMIVAYGRLAMIVVLSQLKLTLG